MEANIIQEFIHCISNTSFKEEFITFVYFVSKIDQPLAFSNRKYFLQLANMVSLNILNIKQNLGCGKEIFNSIYECQVLISPNANNPQYFVHKKNCINAQCKNGCIFSWKYAITIVKDILKFVTPITYNITVLNFFVLYMQSIIILYRYFFASYIHLK